MFKKKLNVESQVDKYKAWLLEKGYSQVGEVNYGDILSTVAKIVSIRLLLSLYTAFDLEIEKMDVKIVFRPGYLEEEI